MADETPKFDARLEEGIAYFEEMLKIMPDDRTTLEFLVVAYDQLGDSEKYEKTLVTLANLLVKHEDLTAAEALLPRLEGAESSDAKVLALKIKRLVAPIPELTPEEPKPLTESEIASEIAGHAIKAEVSLVDFLKEGGVVSETDADAVKKQLQAMPTDGRIFLISALSVLEKENSELAEKCLAFLADKGACPPVPLNAFEPNLDLIRQFPAVELRLRGAIPFGKIGDQVLVAILNPLDERLCADLNRVAKCRFYIALPEQVEKCLAKLFEEVAEG